MSTRPGEDRDVAAGPRWLTPAEERTWVQFVAVQYRLFGALDQQLQADAGIPLAYYLILAMLSDAPDRQLRMSALAGITHTSQSRMSHAVARLEERGWVQRRRLATDRRGQVAVLTDAGLARLVEMAPGHVAEVRRRLFDALTPEQVDQLSTIDAAVLDHLGTGCDGDRE